MYKFNRKSSRKSLQLKNAVILVIFTRIRIKNEIKLSSLKKRLEKLLDKLSLLESDYIYTFKK